MNDYLNSNHDDAFHMAMQAYRSQSVPDGPPDEFVSEVLAALHHAEKAANQSRTINLKERILTMKLTTKITIAATVLIAVGGLLAGLALDGGSALAFSDVAEALANIRTATWKSSTEVEMAGGKLTSVSSGQVLFRAPSCERREMSESVMTFADGSTTRPPMQIHIVDHQSGEQIAISPASKTAAVHKSGNPRAEPTSSLEMFRTMVAKATDAEKLGRQTVDGRKAEAFQFLNNNSEYKLWVDPDTSLPVLVEVTSQLQVSSEVGSKVHYVWSDFRYNMELDESLFSLELPEGYTLVDAKDRPAITLESLLRASSRPRTYRGKVVSKDIGDGKIEVTAMRENEDGTFTTVKTEVRDKPNVGDGKVKVKVTKNADGSFSNVIEQE